MSPNSGCFGVFRLFRHFTPIFEFALLMIILWQDLEIFRCEKVMRKRHMDSATLRSFSWKTLQIHYRGHFLTYSVLLFKKVSSLFSGNLVNLLGFSNETRPILKIFASLVSCSLLENFHWLYPRTIKKNKFIDASMISDIDHEYFTWPFFYRKCTTAINLPRQSLYITLISRKPLMLNVILTECSILTTLMTSNVYQPKKFYFIMILVELVDSLVSKFSVTSKLFPNDKNTKFWTTAI